MTSAGEGVGLSFERDIRPMFRDKDRDSMLSAFDLFDYADVADNADAIVGSLRTADALRWRVACVSGRHASAVD